MDDPLEELKRKAEIQNAIDQVVDSGDKGPYLPDLSGLVKPLPDGIFPKTVTVRLQSTGEIVEEIVIETKKETGRLEFTIPPLQSGNYILEFRPNAYGPEDINVEVDDEPYYPDC